MSSAVPGPWRLAAAGAQLLDAAGTPTPTIFATMSELAARTGAVNLGQGFPDEDGPAEVLAAAQSAIANGGNQYPPGLGTLDLREAIAAHQAHWYGIELDPATQVLVTAGATEAIAAAIIGLTGRGDEIVAAEPFYDEYAALAGLQGARLVPVPLTPPAFLPDPAAFAAAVTDRTRLIIVNSPHNPTGSVWPREILEQIIELAHRHDALILTDEVYEHLVFDGEHVPLASLPGGFERTITVSSGGKTFSATGWKIGWASGPAPLMAALLAVKQWLTYVPAGPFQPAIATGLRLPDEVFHAAARALAGKRDVLAAGLADAGFTVHLPAAGYFIVADAAPLGVTDTATFAVELAEHVGVVGIPVTALVSPEHRAQYATLMRFAFCKRLEVLEDAVRRLAALR